MNRYDEDYDELEIPEHNEALSTNITQLRIEKRLTTKELAELSLIDESKIIAFEKGQLEPTKEEILKLIAILKISYYDMMTRDIQKERSEITIKMKKSKDRKKYDWFYGSKKKVALDIIYLISVPLVFLLAYFAVGSVRDAYNEFMEEEVISSSSQTLMAYLICSIISGVIITINLAGRFHYQFQLWHLLWISALCWLVIVIGLIGTIPYYIYVIVNLIIKKGKNHL